MDYVFSGSIRIPSTPIMNPRNVTSFLKNSHFSGIVLKVVLLSRSNTFTISLAYCSLDPLV